MVLKSPNKSPTSPTRFFGRSKSGRELPSSPKSPATPTTHQSNDKNKCVPMEEDATTDMFKVEEEGLFLDIPSLDEDNAVGDDDNNNNNNNVKQGKVTSPKKSSPPSSPTGWLLRTASAVGSSIVTAGQNTLRLSTSSSKKALKTEYRVKLTMSVELEDLAGDWPGGASIANRVLIAQELEHRGLAREALKRAEAKCEAHLLRLDRLQKNEYDGGVFDGCKPNLMSGIGWDGGPRGPPWLPGGPTSHTYGGTGAAERELIEYTNHDLEVDYLKAKEIVKHTAELTGGEARQDPALILKSNYRRPR
jgi:hypothetical protein